MTPTSPFHWKWKVVAGGEQDQIRLFRRILTDDSQLLISFSGFLSCSLPCWNGIYTPLSMFIAHLRYRKAASDHAYSRWYNVRWSLWQLSIVVPTQSYEWLCTIPVIQLPQQVVVRSRLQFPPMSSRAVTHPANATHPVLCAYGVRTGCVGSWKLRIRREITHMWWSAAN